MFELVVERAPRFYVVGIEAFSPFHLLKNAGEAVGSAGMQELHDAGMVRC